MPTLTRDQEVRLILAMLERAGASREQAEVTAQVLAEGDLRGFASHGLLRLPYILRALRRGTINGKANIRIVRETASTALIDGDHGLGHYVASEAMKLAIEKAKRTGVGAVGVRNTNHFGIAGYYAEMAIKEGLVGIVTTTTDALVHPWGGVEPVLGTNALAVAIPAKPTPILLDMAMSVAARGKIVKALKEGRPIPESWAIGPDGRPTTDPKEALRGALSPFGGVKGYGLCLILEILAGPLVGAAAGKEVVGTLEPVEGYSTKGDFMIAIDPAAFVAPEEFEQRVAAFIRQIKESKKAPGVDEILLPGEPELRTRERRLREGIPISDEVWAELELLARELGLNLKDVVGD
jgi:L-2-hydroxycarboxylate dehydrogenase (NAD+)